MVTAKELYEWCRVPYQELERHPDRKVPFRLVRDSEEMGRVMARELVDEIKLRGELRAIIPCGPACWPHPRGAGVN